MAWKLVSRHAYYIRLYDIHVNLLNTDKPTIIQDAGAVNLVKFEVTKSGQKLFHVGDMRLSEAQYKNYGDGENTLKRKTVYKAREGTSPSDSPPKGLEDCKLVKERLITPS